MSWMKLEPIIHSEVRSSARRPHDTPTRVASAGRKWPLQEGSGLARQRPRPGSELESEARSSLAWGPAPGCVTLGFPDGEELLCPEGGQRPEFRPPRPPYHPFHLLCESNRNNTSVTERVNFNTLRHSLSYFSEMCHKPP